MGSPHNERQGLLPSQLPRSTDAESEIARSSSSDRKAEELAARERALSCGQASSRPKAEDDVSGRREQKDGEDPSNFISGIRRLVSSELVRRTHPDGTVPLTRFQRYYSIGIFTLTASMLYADLNLMAPLLTPIAHEFGFNDAEKDRYLGGNISALFFLVGAPFALTVGYLCDRMNRRHLLFIVVVLGEGPCLATYFVRTYRQLLLVRVMTGISVGGTLPLVYSLVGDLFDVNQRAFVVAAIQVATGIGAAAGQGVSNFVGPSLGWRWPFVIVAVPALLLATLMLLTTSDSPRGAADSALVEQYENVEGFTYKEKLNRQKLWDILSTPSNLFVILQGLPGSLPWGVLLTFFNDFLMEGQHLSETIAFLVIMLYGIGGAVGVIGGGLVGQHLINVRPSLMPLFVGACVCSATLPIWFLINADLAHTPLLWTVLAAFVGGVLSGPPGPNARAVLLNVNEPECRGFALGLMTVLDDIGKGTGSWVVAQLIAIFRRRVPAFNLATAAWIPCGLIFSCAAITLSRDEARMEERLRNKVLLQPVRSSDEADDFSIEQSPRSRTYP